ncbi:hypothetical protein [Gimesia panareensis]|uniref:Uncharacterized protein n=1 Tax=Gimesia panareensis TaxID=2527978 RepID=A0A518FLM6_9PLAN|nr:hypothetical protein [Gimesia panareensis]QDU49501.1 hypothetical protein Pan110_18390 [Gimesia panareensis]QDV17262.1 hypothetical protein Pan153_18970 [Gimesia panareensis]
MKQTVFKFDIRYTGSDDTTGQTDTLQRLIQKLSHLAGVLSVEQTGSRHLPGINIQVEFADSKAATKIHRQLMKTIKQTEHVMIAGVTSTLTDIF